MSSRRRSSRGYDDDYERARSLSRDEYDRMKDEVRRKRQDIEDLEDELEKQVQETKRARGDTQDLWKIYYTLQTEVQEAIKKNAKLAEEKDTAAIELAKKEEELAIAPETCGTNELAKIKEAVERMEKEKNDVKGKYDEIVLENNKLKDAANEVAPKLRQFREMKEKFQKTDEEARNINSEYQQMQQKLGNLINKLSAIEQFKTRNIQLIKDNEEKTKKLDELVEADCTIQTLRSENNHIKVQLEDVEKKLKLEACKVDDAKVQGWRTSLQQSAKELKAIKSDWCQAKEAMAADLMTADKCEESCDKDKLETVIGQVEILAKERKDNPKVKEIKDLLHQMKASSPSTNDKIQGNDKKGKHGEATESWRDLIASDDS